MHKLANVRGGKEEDVEVLEGPRISFYNSSSLRFAPYLHLKDIFIKIEHAYLLQKEEP